MVQKKLIDNKLSKVREQDFCSVKAAPQKLFTKYEGNKIPLKWNFYLNQMTKLSITNCGTA